MAHVHAARAVLPAMSGSVEKATCCSTASAAGLLTQIGSAPYSVTKHAAVALAEWLAVTYHDRGIGFRACARKAFAPICSPKRKAERQRFLLEDALEPEQVAEAVIAGLAKERFLILPHPKVGEYMRRKADDYDRWLRGCAACRRRSCHKQAALTPRPITIPGLHHQTLLLSGQLYFVKLRLDSAHRKHSRCCIGCAVPARAARKSDRGSGVSKLRKIRRRSLWTCA